CRLVEVREPNGAAPPLATQYRLDELDRPTMISDATGRVSARYTYSGPGPAIRIEHAAAGMRTPWYAAAGRLRQRGDGRGRRPRFAYDGEGRMISAVDATDPAHPATIRALTYDGPRLTAVRDGNVDERFAYDAAGRIVATTVDAGGHPLTLRREYGHVGELRAIVHPDGTRISYGYDGALSLRRIDGIVEAIDYDAHGSPERIGWVGGAFSTYVHDPLMRRLVSATLHGGGALVRKIEVTYDVASRVTAWPDEFPRGARGPGFGLGPPNRPGP